MGKNEIGRRASEEQATNSQSMTRSADLARQTELACARALVEMESKGRDPE